MINLLKDVVSNKKRIIAVISLVILIAQSHGLDLTQWIGVDWETTLSNVLVLLGLIGISDNGNIGGDKNDTSQNNQESGIPQENNTTIEVITPPIKTAKDEQIKTLLNQLQQILNS